MFLLCSQKDTVDPWTMGVKGADLQAVQDLYITWLPKNLSCILVSTGGLVPWSLQIPKSTYTQVPYIKWSRLVHAAGPQHLRTPVDQKQYKYLLKKICL